MFKRLKPLYGVNYSLLFIGLLGVGKSTLCNHINQLLRELLTKSLNDDDMKAFYSSDNKQCPHHYRTNKQFNKFLSNNVSTFDINEFHDYDSQVDSLYCNALDNQKAYTYDSRYIVDSHNVIIEYLHVNKPHIHHSSSHQSLNTQSTHILSLFKIWATIQFIFLANHMTFVRADTS